MLSFVKVLFVENSDKGVVETVFDKLEGTNGKVFARLLIYCNQDELVWYSNKDSRNKILEDCGISDIRLKQILAKLVEEGILIRRIRGVYELSRVYVSNQKT